MDIFGILKKEHKAVKDQLKKIQDEVNPSAQFISDIFQQVRRELDYHMMGEEKYFYPSVEAIPDMTQEIREAYEEHRLIHILLGDIDTSATKDTAILKAKLKVLSDVIIHHVKEEESVIFKNAKEKLTKDQIGEITRKYEEEKQKPLSAVLSGYSPHGTM